MKQDQPEQVTRSTLHTQLKKIVRDELEHLPDTLAAMEPAQRVKAVLQLLPYTLPKIETVADTYGENPLDW